MSDTKSSSGSASALQKISSALSALVKPSAPKPGVPSKSLGAMAAVKKNWDRDSLKDKGFKQILGKPGGRFGVMAKIEKNWDRQSLKQDGFKQILGKPGGRFGVMAKIETNWNKASLQQGGFKQILGPKSKSHAAEEIEMADFSSIKAHKKAHEFEDIDLRRQGGGNNGGDDNAEQQLAKRKRANSF